MFREPLVQSSAKRRASSFRPLPRVQPKLARGHASGSAERAADAMASHVMAGQTLSAAPSGLADSEPGLALAPQVARRLSSSKGGGAPLAESVRSQFEPRFAFNFADVRVHSDEPAHAMNQSLGARAFTHGSDIYLSPQVRHDVNPVMAHELAHVTQQTGMLHCLHLGKPGTEPKPIAPSDYMSTAEGLIYSVYAKGDQGYSPSFTEDPAAQMSVPSRKNTPVATLYGPGGEEVGKHGVGSDRKPFWEFKFGKVTGDPSPTSKLTYEGMADKLDAAWVQMNVATASDYMKSKGVNLIRRVGVKGGADPEAKLNGGSGYGQRTSSYTCTYEFYKV